MDDKDAAVDTRTEEQKKADEAAEERTPPTGPQVGPLSPHGSMPSAARDAWANDVAKAKRGELEHGTDGNYVSVQGAATPSATGEMVHATDVLNPPTGAAEDEYGYKAGDAPEEGKGPSYRDEDDDDDKKKKKR